MNPLRRNMAKNANAIPSWPHPGWSNLPSQDLQHQCISVLAGPMGVSNNVSNCELKRIANPCNLVEKTVPSMIGWKVKPNLLVLSTIVTFTAMSHQVTLVMCLGSVFSIKVAAESKLWLPWAPKSFPTRSQSFKFWNLFKVDTGNDRLEYLGFGSF